MRINSDYIKLGRSIVEGSLKQQLNYRNLSTQASPKHSENIVRNTAISAAYIAGGFGVATILPATCPSAVATLILAYFSTRSIQPIVATKLAVQRDPNPNSPTRYPDFFKQEMSLFKHHFTQVMTSDHAHRGGMMYSLRGATGKMLTFAGFDVMRDQGLPIPMAGLASGLVQGALLTPFEYLSTLQSRFPDKTTPELIREMGPYIRQTFGAPIMSMSLRNGLFDMAFNTLRVGFDIPFGPSAVVGMTLNYPIELMRSRFHQNEDPAQVKSMLPIVKHHSQSDQKASGDDSSNFRLYQGWLSKAIEFLLIYQLLQLMKEAGNARDWLRRRLVS